MRVILTILIIVVLSVSLWYTIIPNAGMRRFKFVLPESDPEPLIGPLLYKTLPHLMRNPKSRCPAFQILSPRSSIDIEVVIGIPVKRDKNSHLPETIKSLIVGMTREERQKTLIVVYIGEVDDINYVIDTAYELNLLFEPFFGTLIEVISPSKAWYPNWSMVRSTLGESETRIQYRTKQNLDYIFLMTYAEYRGGHFLMLQDDVLAAGGYMTEMLDYIDKQNDINSYWIYLSFGPGGIAKLFKAAELFYFSAYVQIFYQNMPIDWLLELYLATRVCGLDKDQTFKELIDYDPLDKMVYEIFPQEEENECAIWKGVIRPTYKNKTLFDHNETNSPLNGKIKRVQSHIHKKVNILVFYPHTNPPIRSINSSLQSHDGHSIMRAYNGEDFFWGVDPKANDTIVFWFEPHVKLEKFFIRTGNVQRTTDIIRHGVVEILPQEQKDFLGVQEFDEFGVSEGNINATIGPLSAIRIRILNHTGHWIIINEIELSLN